MIDLHTHLWPHEPGVELPTYDDLAWHCEQAAQVGIEQIAVTEHCHRFVEVAHLARAYWERGASPVLRAATDRVWEVEGGARLDDYVQLLVDAQARGLPLLVGLEVDHLPGMNDALAGLLRGYPFDVLLGSVHWIDDWLFDAYDDAVFAAEWDRRPADAVWEAYVDAVVELLGVGAVDVVAHVDVVKVAGRRPSDPARHERRLCEAIAASGVAVEVSSAGLRKPAGELYPSPSLLAMLHEAGVALTTASDAHRREQLGAGFGVLASALREIGVTEVTTFDRRVRRPIPLV